MSLKPEDFPVSLPYGGTIPNQAALDQYVSTQTKRAKGKEGRAKQIAAWHLEQLKTVGI